MTAEQLEELMHEREANSECEGLQNLAPSLASRVIAAERLVDALDRVLCYILCAADRRMINSALTAYREASK